MTHVVAMLTAAAAAIAPIPPSDVERDAPASEAMADGVSAVAKDICSALRARDLDRVKASLTPTFSGAPPDGGSSLDAASFLAQLQRRLTDAAVIRRCSFKPYQLVTDRHHQRTVARLSLVIAGLDRQGQRFTDSGDVDAAFVARGKTLQVSELELRPRTWTSGQAPQFTDVTDAVGLPSTFPERREPQLMSVALELGTGGLAVSDYDGDGRPDILVQRDGTPLLFHNDGDGHFTEVAAKSGLTEAHVGRGALFVDLDNDGRPDLFLADFNGSGNRLFHNDGDGHFTDVTRKAGVGQRGYFTSVVAADVDGDGLLDLYVCQYQKFGTVHPPFAAHNGRPNLLLHNLGGMRFEEVARTAGVAGSEWTYAAALADLDGDGLPDLVVVNDFGSPRLYRNTSRPGHPRFAELSPDAGMADPGNGMGVDVGDYDGDGKLDVYISKMFSNAGNRLLSQPLGLTGAALAQAREGARGNSLYRNLGDLRFEEVGDPAGVRHAGWAWSCEFGDADNDGRPDLYVANGYFSGRLEDEL